MITLVNASDRKLTVSGGPSSCWWFTRSLQQLYVVHTGVLVSPMVMAQCSELRTENKSNKGGPWCFRWRIRCCIHYQTKHKTTIKNKHEMIITKALRNYQHGRPGSGSGSGCRGRCRAWCGHGGAALRGRGAARVWQQVTPSRKWI